VTGLSYRWEFLASGPYDFFITLPPQRGAPLLYDRVGRVTLPSQKADVLRITSK